MLCAIKIENGSTQSVVALVPKENKTTMIAGKFVKVSGTDIVFPVTSSVTSSVDYPRGALVTSYNSVFVEIPTEALDHLAERTRVMGDTLQGRTLDFRNRGRLEDDFESKSGYFKGYEPLQY